MVHEHITPFSYCVIEHVWPLPQSVLQLVVGQSASETVILNKKAKRADTRTVP